MKQSVEDNSATALLSTRSWRILPLVIVISTAVAVLLGLRHLSDFPQELIVSNVIGVCIWLLVAAARNLSRGRIGMGAALAVAIPLGVIAGGKGAAWFGADDFIGEWTADPSRQWTSITVSLLAAIAASAFIYLVCKAADYRVELETERRRGAEAARSQAVAEMALLQAQIEPHFLFNTLAHVYSSVQQDPATGKAMLEHLIRYLRGTLRRTRASTCRLAEERELVESLLAIASIRLGSRLRYEITMADAVRDARLPSLLLQPLVENSIKHGIEPAVDGGEIRVEGDCVDGMLVLRVSDTGMGVRAVGAGEAAKSEGLGLDNVRARLASLYGDEGRLTLSANEPHGFVAELRLPLQKG
jgi:signal transduction histidine kinase